MKKFRDYPDHRIAEMIASSHDDSSELLNILISRRLENYTALFQNSSKSIQASKNEKNKAHDPHSGNSKSEERIDRWIPPAPEVHLPETKPLGCWLQIKVMFFVLFLIFSVLYVFVILAGILL